MSDGARRQLRRARDRGVRSVLVCAFAGSLGCAHAKVASIETPDESSRVAELEAQNRTLSDELRAMRAQLALARNEATACPAASQVEPARESVRIGASREEAPTVAAAPEDLRRPATRNVAASSEGDRPVLRLYGSPALPLDGNGYITVRERLPTGPDVRPVPTNAPRDVLPVATAPAAPVPSLPPVANAPAATTPTAPNVRPAPSTPSADPAQEEYRTALAHVSARRFREANEELTRFLERHPSHPYTDNALYWRGTVAYAERRYADARRDFERVVHEFPRGNKVADALYHLGMCHLRMGQREEARTYFRRVQTEHPDTVAARLAAREDA